MMDRPPPRREEFDLITMGWGADNVDDLEARIQLAEEFDIIQGGLQFAESKVLNAMCVRLRNLKNGIAVAP